MCLLAITNKSGTFVMKIILGPGGGGGVAKHVISGLNQWHSCMYGRHTMADAKFRKPWEGDTPPT